MSSILDMLDAQHPMTDALIGASVRRVSRRAMHAAGH